MKRLAALLLTTLALGAAAQTGEVVDLPTRAGVQQRVLVLRPQAEPDAVLVLLTGGPGRLGIFDNGSLRVDGNFLIRSRSLFVQQGDAVVLVDVPSDRRDLNGDFRQSAEHMTDLGGVVRWAHAQFTGKKVWLVGTSRGTHSAAEAARALQGDAAPDGIVLTSSILARSRGGNVSARPVTEIDLTAAKLPVLVVHHQQDACPICNPAQLPALMKQLPAGSELLTYSGGRSQGADCEALAYHGYNGIEDRVVADIAAWVKGRR